MQLRESYALLPANVKEVYLAYMLDHLAELNIRSAIIFCSTCKGDKHKMAWLIARLEVEFYHQVQHH